MKPTVPCYDFSRSFLTFRVDLHEKQPITVSHKPPTTLNNARILIESTCTLTHRSSGNTTVYVLGASCKTERVGVDADIWSQPNADFCLAASKEEFLIIKRWHRTNIGVPLYPASLGVQPERQTGAVKDAWTSFHMDLCPAKALVLESVPEIIAATFQNRPLAARIEYDDAEYHVCIDHPVKTINVNERDNIFQTDTGPILLPDFSADRRKQDGRLIEVFDLAYAAFSGPSWAEFIINAPTPVSDGISVPHYSKTRRIEKMKNAILEITQP